MCCFDGSGNLTDFDELTAWINGLIVNKSNYLNSCLNFKNLTSLAYTIQKWQ